MKKVILYGAGFWGQYALDNLFGSERVKCFCETIPKMGG